MLYTIYIIYQPLLINTLHVFKISKTTVWILRFLLLWLTLCFQNLRPMSVDILFSTHTQYLN